MASRPNSRKRSTARKNVRCYSAGYNFFCQVRGDPQAKRAYDGAERLVFVEELRPTHVACGGTFTYAVCDKAGGGGSRVYRWGTQTGMVYRAPEPVALQMQGRVSTVACGNKHTLLMMESGHVLSCGTGYFGQLGHGNDSSIHEPKLIKGLDPTRIRAPCVGIAAGYAHSAAITADGKVFLWGFNRSHQCGVQGKVTTLFEPRQLLVYEHVHASNGRVVQVVCGRHHSAVLTESGGVYTWGATSFGRLGVHKFEGKSTHVPSRVTTLDNFEIKCIASGDFHMLALSSDRRVFSWGYGAEGQCGHGNCLHLRTPRPIDALKNVLVSRIACGGWHSAAITADGYVYTWGYGDGGWLFHSTDIHSVGARTRPVVEPGPPTQKHSDTRSFDSNRNQLTPALVNALAPFQVTSVACGGAHSVVMALAREQGQSPTGNKAVHFQSDVQGVARSNLSPSVANMRAHQEQQRRLQQHEDQQLQHHPHDATSALPAQPGAENGGYEYSYSHPHVHGTYDAYSQPHELEQEQAQAQAHAHPHTPYSGAAGSAATQHYEPYREDAENVAMEGGSSAAKGEVSAHDMHATAHAQPLVDTAQQGEQVQQRHHPQFVERAVDEPKARAVSAATVMGGVGSIEHGLATMGPIAPAPLEGGRPTGHVDTEEAGVGEELDEAEQAALVANREADGRREEVFSLCRHNRVDNVRDALLGGFPVDDTDENGNTLLFIAAQNGLKSAVRLCLKHGADINQRNSRGNTPLHYCFKYSHHALGAYMVEKGADDTITNHDGLTVYEQGAGT